MPLKKINDGKYHNEQLEAQELYADVDDIIDDDTPSNQMAHKSAKPAK